MKIILLKIHEAEIKSEVWDVMCDQAVLLGKLHAHRHTHTHTHLLEYVCQALCILLTFRVKQELLDYFFSNEYYHC